MKTVRYFLPEIVIVALAMISPSGFAAALSATWTYLAEHLFGLSLSSPIRNVGFAWCSLAVFITLNFLRAVALGGATTTELPLDGGERLVAIGKRLLLPVAVLLAAGVAMSRALTSPEWSLDDAISRLNRPQLLIELIGLWVIALFVVEITQLIVAAIKNPLRSS
jgi:hypothetical protein